MTFLFPQSKKRFFLLFAIGIIASIILFFTSSDTHMVIRIIRSVLLIVLGAMVGLILATQQANKEHQKQLNLLYKNLDIEDFIKNYEPLVEKSSKKGSIRTMMTNYLAVAYSTLGNQEKAIRLLKPTVGEKTSEKANLEALSLVNLCQFYLLQEDYENAEIYYKKIENLMVRSAQHHSLVRNLNDFLKLFNEYFKFQNQQPFDTEYLEEVLPLAPNPLHKSNISLLLAREYLAEEKPEQAKPLLEDLAQLSDSMAVSHTAKELLNTL